MEYQSLPFQFNHYQFRRIVDPEWDNTVAHSPADDHRGVFLDKLACIIPWEEPLIGSHQPADKRQPELTAVGMTAEHQINPSVYINIKQLRPVGQ